MYDEVTASLHSRHFHIPSYVQVLCSHYSLLLLAFSPFTPRSVFCSNASSVKRITDIAALHELEHGRLRPCELPASRHHPRAVAVRVGRFPGGGCARGALRGDSSRNTDDDVPVLEGRVVRGCIVAVVVSSRRLAWRDRYWQETLHRAARGVTT